MQGDPRWQHRRRLIYGTVRPRLRNDSHGNV
jgi:hypothetical protein